MVQLTEVIDEHFQEDQPGPEEDDDFTDTDSEISEESDYDPESETLADRLYALRDVVSPTTRGYVSAKVSAVAGAVGAALSLGGRTLWVVSSSALLLGVPWALAWAEEQQVLEMEKEMKMREMGSEILTAGGGADPMMGGSSTAAQVGAALGGGGGGHEAKPAL